MRDRAIMLALAALYDLADRASTAPLVPSLELRAMLGLLHAWSSGDRGPYIAFWRACQQPVPKEHSAAAGYERATYSRTAWTGIVRSLGLEPQSMVFHDAIAGLIASQRLAVEPADLASRAIVAILKDAAGDRDIIAKKGHPQSERGRQLLAERLARGERPDGTKIR